MSTYPVVKIEGVKVEENSFSCENKVWFVANLIERAKSLPVFDLPLAAIYTGLEVWDPVSSSYDLAVHMRRVLDVDTAHPIILDQKGCIMDGWHRVARALIDRKTTIRAVRFEVTPPCDFEKSET